jgi:hypothetical protein
MTDSVRELLNGIWTVSKDGYVRVRSEHGRLRAAGVVLALWTVLLFLSPQVVVELFTDDEDEYQTDWIDGIRTMRDG